jgi:phytoene/squalene synthetase
MVSDLLLAPADFVRSPEALQRRCSLEEARAYTRWLATSHYENFHVVSFLLPRRQQLSDATCTALQLANFWQDVTVDLLKDRVYIPLALMERHGCAVQDLFDRRFTPAFRETMREAVNTARELFVQGLPLARMLDRRLAVDIDLFSRGGMRVLDRIERQDFNVLAARPAISKMERVGLLLGSVVRAAFSRAA